MADWNAVLDNLRVGTGPMFNVSERTERRLDELGKRIKRLELALADARDEEARLFKELHHARAPRRDE